MKQFDIIFLLLVILSAEKVWRPTILIDEEHTYSHSDAIFLDQSSNVSYVSAYYQKSVYDRNYTVGTKKISEDDEVGPMTEIAQRLDYGVLTGANDGKHLFYVYLGQRNYSSHNPYSCYYDQDSCLEIFFTESEDMGKTWSRPIKINRQNYTDPINRKQPVLVYLKETKRIFIFYVIEERGTGNKIGYVTRSPGSDIFSNEQIIDISTLKSSAYDIGVGYTVRNSLPILHLIVRTYYHLYHMKSENNGVTWSTPTELADVDYQSMTSYKAGISVLSDTSVDPSSFYLIYVRFDYPRYKWTHNHGESWSSDFIVTDLKADRAQAALCTNSKNKIITILSMESDMRGLQSNVIDVGNWKIHNTDFAFTGYEGFKDIAVSCMSDKDDDYHFTFKAVSSTTYKGLYDRGEYFLPKPSQVIE